MVAAAPRLAAVAMPIYSMRFKNGFSFDYAYSYNAFEEYKGNEFKNFAQNFIGFRYTPNEKLSIFSDLKIESTTCIIF